MNPCNQLFNQSVGQPQQVILFNIENRHFTTLAQLFGDITKIVQRFGGDAV
jgi:hypothetical protein